jgi:predicted phosphate transport protein (TIGR00153 family)
MVLARLMPREDRFFDWIEQNARNLVDGGATLVRALEQPETLEVQARRLTEIEGQADEVTHEIMAGLNRTFVTSLDRDDVAALANRLDDMLDVMEVALRRMVLFKLHNTTELAQGLARVALQQAETINRAAPLLREPRTMRQMHDCIVEINRLENQGDRYLEQALESLYSDGSDVSDLIHRLKWKEVYELLELATDRAEDVANVLESIALRYA